MQEKSLSVDKSIQYRIKLLKSYNNIRQNSRLSTTIRTYHSRVQSFNNIFLVNLASKKIPKYKQEESYNTKPRTDYIVMMMGYFWVVLLMLRKWFLKTIL